MTDPFVVVGGDAAGLSAASKCKRENPDREVIVFEKGRWISFAYCGMPYYIKGEVERIGDLLSLTPSEVADRGIDLRRGHEVTAIDPSTKSVMVDGDGRKFEQTYGDLLIATGASASTEPIDGTALENVFTMHHMDQAAALRALFESPECDPGVAFEAPYLDLEFVNEYLDRAPPDSAAIVGGGFVGVEMAEAFRGHGVETHLFHRSATLLPPFGKAVGTHVATELRDQGVTLHLDTDVSALVGDGTVEAVSATDGRTPVDCALVGIGIEPNTALLEGTDIGLGNSGAISTDEYGRTNVDNVFAAGDCAEMRHAVTGEPDWVPLGLTANRAGRAIGRTVAGTPEPVGDIAGTAVLKAFNLECGRTGLVDATSAREAGYEPITETVTAGSRSGYYPGNAETTVTLVADVGTERLLGGAIVGADRAAIRIDVLATTLETDTTVAELERFDLAYAPPFSPVWDPVLVAAKVLRGSLEDAKGE